MAQSSNHPKTTTDKVPANIGAIQETLLIPLYGRYRVSKKAPKVFCDDEALRMVPLIDYDFAKFDKATGSINGSVFRTLHYDDLVKQFIDANPKGSVIEIGSGLNNRFKRLDNGTIHWLDMDLPDVMMFKARLEHAVKEDDNNKHDNGVYGEAEWEGDLRYQSIAADISKPKSWQEAVKALPKPWCFVSEAAIIYLDNDAAKSTLASMSELVSSTHTGDLAAKAQLIMDTCATDMVENQHRHDAMKLMPKASWFRFKCDNPKQVAQFGDFKLLRQDGFLDLDASVFKPLSKPMYVICRYFPFLIRQKMSWYQMCVYQVGARTAGVCR